MTTIPTIAGDLVIEHPADGIAVMRMPTQFDVYTASPVREAAIDIINAGTYRIIADLTGVELIDSTGLGVLVGMLKRTRAHDGTVVLAYSDERMAKVLRVTTMAKVFDRYTSVGEAITALQGTDSLEEAVDE